MGKSNRPEPSSARVLSAAFLEKHTSKKDLIRRLREVVEALNDPDVEPNSPDFPGLGGLSAVLIQDSFIKHRDKEVRLHTVLACMQILEVYAPEAPYNETEVLRIFSQLIRQLANLAHCTSPSQANYQHYHKLLELLSDVKIGVILVELTKTLDVDHSPSRDEAMEMLADLIRTILQCVHVDHPPDVADHAVTAVSVCLEEFDGTMPIPIMDEILVSISAGPVVMVTNPDAVEAAARSAAAKKKGSQQTDEKMPPLQIQQTNPSYMVAAAIIRRSVDRVSTPIANFLNGLLNGDPCTFEQTNIVADEDVPAADGHYTCTEKQSNANVWTIIYELHKISPQILTTVIGTVTNSLQSPNLERRLRVTKLLGRLFFAPTSKIGIQFSPCYREWIRRSTDISHKVRLAMVKHLVTILANKGHEEALAKDASDAMVKMIEHDPNLDVRLEAIRQVCDLAYREGEKKSNAAVPARLLLAVGNRVSSKIKTERRDALTGLAQIYHRHYVATKLNQVQRGGDDCEMDIILEALRDTYEAQGGSAKKKRFGDNDGMDSFDLDEKYKWIPSLVFKSACFTDANDPEMRNRVVQIVDDVLLGGKKDTFTPTSQAVGLAFIIASLRDEDEDPRGPITSNAYKWMCTLFSQRASLQHAVANYLDARAKIKASKQGTEEALAAEADAMERLEIVATLTAPLPGSVDIREVLKKLHTARDKHIFRILATISCSDHSASARVRAFDELPKRTKSLGDATSSWVKMLARRCAMSNFLNVEIVNQCILLAQECFQGGHIPECAEFLTCVKTAVEIYPALGGTKEGFGTLMELFGECRAGSSSKTKKLIEEYDMVTTLSSILATAAPAMAGSGSDKEKPIGAIDSDLQAQLLNLCTRDGTPEQARHAVYTMAALLNPTKDATHGKNEREILTWEEQQDTFGSLLKSLTSPSRMSLGTSCDNTKIVSILTALAALAECAPAVFRKDGNSVVKGGEKSIKFALETCLLGRGPSMDDPESEASDEEMAEDEEPVEAKTPNSAKSKRRQSRKSPASKHMTPDGTKSAVEDENLSLACRRVCAAIEFLVSYIRHAGKSDFKTPVTASEAPAERVEQVFGILCQIIEDGGLPPATRDRRCCKARHDRAALRKCAAIHLLRLCDSRLRLEATYLTHARWHVLAGSLLDEEKSVRDGIMEELSMMLTGKGTFRPNGSTFAPGLRFLAMVALCTDIEPGAAHSGANANAANVGKRSATMKTAAMHCISGLRKTCDATLAQCRALGAAAEHKFETRTKMMIMPEYAVPFALHLLSFRRETPSAGGSTGTGLTQPTSTQPDQDEQLTVEEESRHKMLRKRLKWLFEPLVQSLGEGADNISFLLRMVDFLGNQYHPNDVGVSAQEATSPMSQDSILSQQEDETDAACRSAALSAAKLKIICVASREVLLSFVKKDVNLTPYPGGIQLPASLFRRAQGSEKLSVSQESGPSSARSSLDSSVSEARVVERKRKAAPSGGAKSTGRKSWQSRKELSPTNNAFANRDSLDSNESMGNTDSPRRNSRVHFSPELEQRRSIPLSQESDETRDVDFEGLSPIAKSHSPTLSREDSSVSEVKTLGTTPPSILRTAPEDDASTDVEIRLSLDSTASSSGSARRSTRRSARSMAETPEIIQHSEETMTTSETPLSDIQADDAESHSSGEKRKLKRREESTRRRKKSKKESPVPAATFELNRTEAKKKEKSKSKKESLPPAAKIELNRNEATQSKKSTNRQVHQAKVSSTDEFSFSDDENVENSQKVSKKPISSVIIKKAKKPVTKGKSAAAKKTTSRTSRT